MHHYRKTRRTYAKLNAGDTIRPMCTFCSDDILPRVIAENNTMMVIPNRVSYDIFEGRRVLDHLMIIPRRHVEGADMFTDQEKIDHMTLVGQYEVQGYNVYARGAGSITRSVAHRHTHLIKLEEKRSKAIVHIEKPYFLLKL